MITVSLDSVRAAAQALVAERGDQYRYTVSPFLRCHYLPLPMMGLRANDETDPRMTSGCLIGEILCAHGVPQSALRLAVNAKSLIEQLADEEIILVQEPRSVVSNWLLCAQGHQDSASTWAEAIQAADAQAPVPPVGS